MAASSHKRPVLLAVDDDGGVLGALHVVFDERYTVLEARDGAAALAVLRSEAVDLVVLALLLEGLDGIAVLERIRADGIDVPVVILSAINTAWTAAAAMRLGAVDYVTKPFDDNELLKVVNSALRYHAEAAKLRLPPQLAHLVLVGCPLGLAAALTAALAGHAWVEAIPSLHGALALRTSVSPDAIVLDPENGPNGYEMLVRTRACFPLASLIVLKTLPGGDGRIFDMEAAGYTIIPKPVSPSGLLDGIRAELRPTITTLPHFSSRTARVMEYIEAHFSNTSTRDLGRVFETSPYYLSRLFRSETGMTLREYVNRVRVEAARQLLLESSEKIETVAAHVGLHDASHLSRLFFKYSGRRPGNLRRAS